MTDKVIERFELYRILGIAVEELDRARVKFPVPNNTTLAFAEESGEVVKAVMDHMYGNTSLDDVRKEIAQTIAMCFRLYLEGDLAIGLPPLTEEKEKR